MPPAVPEIGETEADSMAFETSLARPRSSRESHSGSPFTPSTPRLVVR